MARPGTRIRQSPPQIPATSSRKSLRKPKEMLGPSLGGTGTAILNGFIQSDYNAALEGYEGLVKYEKMRKSDAQVQATLLVMELPIRATEWYVEPAKDENNQVTPEAQEHADFVSKALFERMDITWDDYLREILLMLPFGHSVFEKVYTADDEHVWLQTMGPRGQLTIQKWITEDGSPGITQTLYAPVVGGPNNDKRIVSIPAEKLVVFTFRREGDNLEGVSVLRSAYKHWYMKDNLYKFDAVKHERQGIGIPVMTLPENANPGDQEKAEEILQRFRANEQSGVVIPFGYKFEFANLQAGTSSDMKWSIEHHNAMIAKNVLAMFMELVSGDGGSKALSEDQSDFFLLADEAIATQIDDVHNRYVVPELVDFNFENVQDYPKLCHKKLGSIDYTAIISAVTSAIDSGAIEADFDLETYLRSVMGLPPKMTPEDRAAIMEEEAEAGLMDPLGINDPIQEVDAEGNPIETELDDNGDPVEPVAEAPAPVETPEPTEADITAAASQVDVQLNGAQITAATQLVAAVAAGSVPRDAGLSQLEILFNLTPEQALAIMGSAGTTTKLQPNPVAGAVQASEPRLFVMDNAILAFHEKQWLQMDGEEFRVVSESTKKKISESLKRKGKRSRIRQKPGAATASRKARLAKKAGSLKQQQSSATAPAKSRISKALKNLNRKSYSETVLPPYADAGYMAMSELVDNKRILALQNSVDRRHHPALRTLGFRFNAYEDSAWRGLTFAERKVNLSSLEKALQKADAQLTKDMDATTAKMKEDLLEQVKKAVDANDIKAVGKIKAKYTGELSSALTDVQKQMFDVGKTSAATEMSVKSPATPSEVKGVMRVGNDAAVDKFAQDMETAAASAVTQVASKRGGSITATGVAEAVGAASAAIDKVIEAQAALKTLAMTGSVNLGRAAIFERFPEMIYGFQYSAILDDKTTDTCLSLDGRVVPAGSPDFYTYGPPRHYNCRSIWVEILKDEEFKPEFTDIPSSIPSNATIDTHTEMKAPELRPNSPAQKLLKKELEERQGKLDQLEKDEQYPNRQEAHRARIDGLKNALGDDAEFGELLKKILIADGILFRD